MRISQLFRLPFVGNILQWALGLAYYVFHRYVTRHQNKAEVGRWFKDGGNSRWGTNYPLDQRSLVIDLGGFLGEFTDAIRQRYHCRVHIVEPVPKFSAFLREKYRRDPDVTVHSLGLADRTYIETIFVAGDGSSVIKQAGTPQKIQLLDIKMFLEEVLKVGKVDLLSINIEGGEYTVIERLIQTGLINRIDHLQVQFHDCIPDAARHRSELVQQLLRTHAQRYSYPFVWEGFSKRKTTSHTHPTANSPQGLEYRD